MRRSSRFERDQRWRSSRRRSRMKRANARQTPVVVASRTILQSAWIRFAPSQPSVDGTQLAAHEDQWCLLDDSGSVLCWPDAERVAEARLVWRLPDGARSPVLCAGPHHQALRLDNHFPQPLRALVAWHPSNGPRDGAPPCTRPFERCLHGVTPVLGTLRRVTSGPTPRSRHPSRRLPDGCPPCSGPFEGSPEGGAPPQITLRRVP